jgi:hypothetical protein
MGKCRYRDLTLPKLAMTPIEVEQVYGIKIGTLANWRYRKVGPKYYRISRKVFYTVRDFNEWFRRNPVLPESEE